MDMMKLIEERMNVHSVFEIEKNVYGASTFTNPPRVTLEVTELEKTVKVHINEINFTVEFEKGELK